MLIKRVLGAVPRSSILNKFRQTRIRKEHVCFKNEGRYGLSKIGNGHQKLSFVLCVQLHFGMKLLAVAFVWFLMQTCTEQQGWKFMPKNSIFFPVFCHKIGILLSKYYKEHTTI